MHAQLEVIDKYIVRKYGFSLADLDKRTGPKLDYSFWKSELAGIKTTGFLEEALKPGLDKLLMQFSPKWLKRQYALSQVQPLSKRFWKITVLFACVLAFG